MAAQPSVWIVIPTWNRREDLLACLASLQAVHYQPRQVLVIDNASEDGSAKAVWAQFPDVELIALPKNLGAPAASNIGFTRALDSGADFVLRLDSDTLVPSDFLAPLVSAMQAEPSIGVISPKIFYHVPPDLIWYAGVDAHPFHFGAIHDLQNQKDSPLADRSREVDYAWGAAMMIRRDVLEKTGGFDPQFFIYYEEVDFCQRVQALDYQIYYLAESKIWHKVGIQNTSAWTAYQWNRSKMLLYRKHARNVFHKTALVLYTFAYALAAPILKAGRSGNRGPLASALKGLWQGLMESI